MKKLWIMPLALVLSAACITAAYAAAYNIILDNKVFTPKNPIMNINDRILLPFREIGEAMGATVEWYEPERKVISYLGNRYSFMYINSTSVKFGEFAKDENGFIQYKSENYINLDVAPTIINDWTYIPVRGFAETLGAVVDWNATTNTAYVTSPDIDSLGLGSNGSGSDEEEEDSYANMEKPDNYGDFSNTSYFRIISSETAKNMYQDSNNKPFIFVIYNSTLDSSKFIVPTIQDTAQEYKYRIYGVDMSDPENKESHNAWLWEGFFRERDFKDPTIYFVYSRLDVEQIQAPKNMDAFRTDLTRFMTKAETEYDYADFDDTTYFRSKSDTFIRNAYNGGEEFLLALYDSTDNDSKLYIPAVKGAAKSKEIVIYGLDIDKYPNFYKNVPFLEDFRYDATGTLPIIFSVYEDEYDLTYVRQPATISRVEGIIDEFIDNSYYSADYGDIYNSTLVNTSISNLESNFVANNESFVVVLYNSSQGYTRKYVENIASIINTNNYLKNKSNRYFGINEASTYYNNSGRTVTWLYGSSSQRVRNSDGYPVIIYFRNGSAYAKLVDAIDEDQVYDFLYDYRF